MDDLDSRRSAFCAIVGRPNVGKSRILNNFVGKKVTIVSPKPQTTRNRILGVATRGDFQLAFLDTPGLLKPRNSLGDYMVHSVEAALGSVDFCLLVVEADSPISNADFDLMRRFKDEKLPAVLAINKIDLLEDKTRLMGQIEAYMRLFDFSAVVPVSARIGSGMDDLWGELIKFAEPGGFLFPEDTLTDQPEHKIASEMVREKILMTLRQEVPHGVAAVTEEFKERGDILDIMVTIYCERESHKGIIVGKGGETIKKIGTLARGDMERFFGCRVNLDLWVKVKEDWRTRPQVLESLGFSSRDFNDLDSSNFSDAEDEQ